MQRHITFECGVHIVEKILVTDLISKLTYTLSMEDVYLIKYS